MGRPQGGVSRGECGAVRGSGEASTRSNLCGLLLALNPEARKKEGAQGEMGKVAGG